LTSINRIAQLRRLIARAFAFLAHVHRRRCRRQQLQHNNKQAHQQLQHQQRNRYSSSTTSTNNTTNKLINNHVDVWWNVDIVSDWNNNPDDFGLAASTKLHRAQ
jgi:hypothetical protein